MSYTLAAFIGKEPIVEAAAAMTGQHRVSRLAYSLHMLELSSSPMSEGRFSEQFYFLTPQLASVAAIISTMGDIGYIEAEFFGGEGSQACMVWREGDVVFGPFREDDEDPPVAPLRDWPINRALRFFGIRVDAHLDEHMDEFRTVDLGRFR
ncbi:MAG TPA: hypothetical protein VF218_08225 [Acidothermaceae bacterium]|jgi:hypothetical protein